MKPLSLLAVLLFMLAQPSEAQNLTFGMILHNKFQYEKALRHFVPLAEKGDPKAQFYLGLMYDNGQGLPQDFAKSFNWWLKAAEQDNKGQSVPQYCAKSVIWYRKAAEQGIAPAQHNLGVAYYNGKCVTQDFLLAYIWLSVAATNGDRFASENRDKLAKRMTRTNLSKAQAIANTYQVKPVLCRRP